MANRFWSTLATRGLHHRAQHLAGCLQALKAVGIGEEIAFEVLGSGIEIGNQSHLLSRCRQNALLRSQLGILDGLGDVEEVEALGNRHRAGINIAAHDALRNR